MSEIRNWTKRGNVWGSPRCASVYWEAGDINVRLPAYPGEGDARERLPPELLATLLRERGWTCEAPAPVVATGLSTPIPLVQLREDDPSMREVIGGLRSAR